MRILSKIISLWTAAFLSSSASFAQVEVDRAMSHDLEQFGELSQCKEYISLARDIYNNIVDYIKSPRPQLRCGDFGKVRWDGSKTYSIIRISNPQFCYETFCFTVVYNERTLGIAFSTDAANTVDRFTRAANHIHSLDKIWNHRFKNTHNGVLLETPDGYLAISDTNGVLTISISSADKKRK
jgi:hypothetical protein